MSFGAASSAISFSRLAELNWFIIALVSTIALIGVAMMISAGGGSLYPWAMPQLLRFGLGFVLMLAVALLSVKFLFDYAYVFYGLCLAVLVVVDIAGFIGMGAQRWIRLGGVNLQPSEFMKLAVILALARYYHNSRLEDIRKLSNLIVPLVLVGLPAALILRQPNLGTTAILVSVSAIMAFMAGVKLRWFALAIILAASAAPVGWHFMHDYQKRRVMTFLDPQADPLGAGYNILQSMIAVGSGGVFGKGYLRGSQSQLNFLPEKQTDFIFTTLAEEFGFTGGLMLLGMYALLILAGTLIGLRCRHAFGSMIAFGVTAMVFIHILINVGMVMGMLPVVGVPLPLMSYGGSIMLSTMLGMGLLLNAHASRDVRLSASNNPLM